MTLPAPSTIPPARGFTHRDAGPVRMFIREVSADGVPGQSYQYHETVKNISTLSMKDQANLRVRVTSRRIPGSDAFNLWVTKLTDAEVAEVQATLAKRADEAQAAAAALNGTAA